MEKLFLVDTNAEASRYELAVNLGCSKLMLQRSLEDNDAQSVIKKLFYSFRQKMSNILGVR